MLSDSQENAQDFKSLKCKSCSGKVDMIRA